MHPSAFDISLTFELSNNFPNQERLALRAFLTSVYSMRRLQHMRIP
jgi:hypothetical protein